jgi:hypothetical protein
MGIPAHRGRRSDSGSAQVPDQRIGGFMWGPLDTFGRPQPDQTERHPDRQLHSFHTGSGSIESIRIGGSVITPVEQVMWV